jgi:hypothetical protein
LNTPKLAMLQTRLGRDDFFSGLIDKQHSRGSIRDSNLSESQRISEDLKPRIAGDLP